MLYLEQVDCNAVFKNRRLKNSFYRCRKSGLREFYMNIGFNDEFMTIAILLSFCRTLPTFVNIN